MGAGVWACEGGCDCVWGLSGRGTSSGKSGREWAAELAFDEQFGQERGGRAGGGGLEGERQTDNRQTEMSTHRKTEGESHIGGGGTDWNRVGGRDGGRERGRGRFRISEMDTHRRMETRTCQSPEGRRQGRRQESRKGGGGTEVWGMKAEGGEGSAWPRGAGAQNSGFPDGSASACHW